MSVNGGSPVGPGFVVFERAPGLPGYDLKMARASIGPGWRPLVDVLFEKIEHDKTYNPNSGFVHTIITQVKEKYGTLTIYFFSFYDWTQPSAPRFDEVSGFIDALQAMSARICEACGAPGKIRAESWVLTLCDACDAKPRSDLHALFKQTEQME